MVIFRMENQHGVGPYSSLSDLELEKIGLINSAYVHPAPHRDIPDFKYKDDYDEYYFGFISLEALFEWFPEDVVNRMKPYGLEVVSYEVDENNVLIGNKQLAFIKSEAKKVNVYNRRDGQAA